MRLLVVGGGPAGVSAALQARELGEDVTLLEAEQVGGTQLEPRAGAGPYPGPRRSPGERILFLGRIRA